MHSVIEWKDAKKELPDSDTTVLIYSPTKRTWLGWWCDSEDDPDLEDSDDPGEWRDPDGWPLRDVSYWAELPEPRGRCCQTCGEEFADDSEPCRNGCGPERVA